MAYPFIFITLIKTLIKGQIFILLVLSFHKYLTVKLVRFHMIYKIRFPSSCIILGIQTQVQSGFFRTELSAFHNDVGSLFNL